MARLPNPGSDNGTWGDILNDFLSVEHNPDGTLRASGSLGTKADDTAVIHLTGNESIGGVKTFVSSPVVPTPALGNHAASKSYVDSTISGGSTPDADASTKGKIQLTGDIGGTAASPQIISTHLSSALPISQGGTGSTTQNFVDLTSDQTIGGVKTFNGGQTKFTVNRTDDQIILARNANAAGLSGFVAQDDIGNKYLTFGVNNSTSLGGNYGLPGEGIIRGSSSATGLALSAASGPIRFLTGAGAERVRVDSTGSLLINTTSTNAKLTVAPIAYAGSQSGGISLINSGTTVRWESYYNLVSDSGGVPRTAQGFILRDATGTVTNSVEAISIIANSGNPVVGLNTASPTHSLTLPSTATGIALYNTSDQTTNYERVRQYWSGNNYNILSEAAGTGAVRSIVMQNSAGTSVSVTNTSTGAIVLNRTSLSTANSTVVLVNGTIGATSGSQNIVNIAPTINQSAAASYTALLVNPTETATGSGTKLLADFQVGGTSKTSIDNSGNHIFHSGATSISYNTSDETNYERAHQYWSGNVYYIRTESSGTGASRALSLASAVGASVVIGGNVSITKSPGSNGGIASFNGSVIDTTGNTQIVTLSPTINQSSTAGYTALLVNPTETATGSGTKLLADFQVGGTSKTSIDNGGNHIFHSGAGAYSYGTTDETTNYERIHSYWSGTAYFINAETAGTGQVRSIAINASTIMRASISVNGSLQSTASGSTAGGVGFLQAGTYTATAGTQYPVSIAPTINQSSTAGYTALLVNPTETATGSGTRLLADFQVGGTSKTSIDNAGNHIFHTGALSYFYNTTDETTNYERFKIAWTSNILTLGTEAGGTGLNRDLRLKTLSRSIYISELGTGGIVQFNNSTNNPNIPFIAVSGSFGTSSGTSAALSLAPTIAQSGTSGYSGILLNVTETSLGSGTKYLADFQVGGTSKMSIDNSGTTIFHTGAGANFYNTTDETTNYERAQMSWSGNVFVITNNKGGIGSVRNMQINANGTLTLYGGATSTQLVLAGSNASANLFNYTVSGGLTAAAQQNIVNISSAINQSGTAGYTALLVNITETATGSGSKLLADFQVGGSSKVKIDNTGAITATSISAKPVKRTATTTSSATPAINTDVVDYYSITALAVAITGFTMTGTPSIGQTLWISITDNGTARAITWGTSFEASTVALPITTTASTRMDVGFVWNETTSKWRVIAMA